MVCVSWFLAVAALLASEAYCEDGTVPGSVERKKKVEELRFSPLATLVIVKFKLALIALLVLLGTAATTKFVAGLFHFLGYERRRPYRPIYLKGTKYEAPNSEHFYLDQPYLHHYAKTSVERAIRNIERAGT